MILDKSEATELAAAVLDSLRALPYRELVGRLLDSSEHHQAVGESGISYQIEAQAFWESVEPGNLRVLVAIDGGGWRAWSPLSFDFIMTPDGTFVGE